MINVSIILTNEEIVRFDNVIKISDMSDRRVYQVWLENGTHLIFPFENIFVIKEKPIMEGENK